MGWFPQLQWCSFSDSSSFYDLIIFDSWVCELDWSCRKGWLASAPACLKWCFFCFSGGFRYWSKKTSQPGIIVPWNRWDFSWETTYRNLRGFKIVIRSMLRRSQAEERYIAESLFRHTRSVGWQTPSSSRPDEFHESPGLKKAPWWDYSMVVLNQWGIGLVGHSLKATNLVLHLTSSWSSY